MPRFITITMVLGLGLATGAPGARAAPALSADTLRGFHGRSVPIERGSISVPVRHASPDAEQLTIGFLRLPTRATSPRAPIVFLMGGPGIPASVMGRVPPYFDLFDRLRDVADVILFDQRGVGMSSPVLDCPPDTTLPPDLLLSREALARWYVGRLARCASAWRARGVRPESYETAESAHDLEALRRALGLGRIQLLAFSYGTHLALAYLRDHGDAVESAVLVGTRGPDHSLKRPAALDRQIDRLAPFVSDRPGGAPPLRESVRGALETLEREPLAIEVRLAPGSMPRTMQLGPAGLAILIQARLSDGRAVTSLPGLLAGVRARDPAAVAPAIEQALSGLTGTATLMGREVDCASGASDTLQQRVAKEAEQALLGDWFDNRVRARDLCEAIGAARLGSRFRSPVRSNVRTLFLTGDLDANTPIANADEVRRGFPNSTHLVVAHGFHELLPVPDVQKAVADFLAGSDVSGRTLAASKPSFPGP